MAPLRGTKVDYLPMVFNHGSFTQMSTTSNNLDPLGKIPNLT